MKNLTFLFFTKQLWTALDKSFLKYIIFTIRLKLSKVLPQNESVHPINSEKNGVDEA